VDDRIRKFDIVIKKIKGLCKEVVMDRKECGSSNRFTLTLSFILLNLLAVTGCATLGDIEAANERTQQSINAFKKESRESQADLSKRLKALQREIKSLKNTDKKFGKADDKILKENQELRASLLGVTATMKEFLNAEKRRYEDGLRWIDNANKSMGKEISKVASAPPLPQFPGSGSTPSPKTPPGGKGAAASSPSPPPKTPPAATASSSGPPSGTPAAATAPSQSPPPGASAVVAPAVVAPAVVAATASETKEAPIVLNENEKPTIKILEIVINPPKVERKSKFTVTVKYDLEEKPDTPKLKYLERVVLLKGTLSIQNLKETVEREPGTNFYSRTIEVPADAPTGVYTIKGVVSGGSVLHSKIKTFMVK
jgi:hypothetical protein